MKKILSLILVLTTLMACSKKNTDTYPAVSSEGKNIWACKVNGEPVIYEGKQDFTGGGVKASVYNTESTVTSMIISGSGIGYKGFYDLQNIQFNQLNPELNKKYYFNSDICFLEYTNHGLGLSSIPYGYWASYSSSGWVKFSSIQGIVSGEYELNVINIGDTTYPIDIKYDTLHITEGRFDIKR